MAKFKVDYHVDEMAFSQALNSTFDQNQHQFSDEFSQVIRLAASRVIYGNFMDQGRYNPRPIGEFTNPRARYHRGWLEQHYGSQRAYQSQLGRGKDKEKKSNFDHLRNVALLDAVASTTSSNPSLRQISAEATKAKLHATDPLADKSGLGFDNLRGYLRSGGAKKITRAVAKSQKEESKPSIVPKSGKMRYGVQTGKLAAAWRDLTVSSLSPRELNIRLNPTMGSMTGSPSALQLTEYLSKNKGWRGLMDHNQLVEALKDQGVIVLNGKN